MLKDDIQKAMISALKGRRETDLKVLRFVISEIKYAEIARQKDLSDQEVQEVLAKELKKRKEAVEMFRKNNRPEMVEEEEKQIRIIETYLPKQMSDEELGKIIEETLASLEDKTNTGKVIGAVMAKVKGKADGAKVSSVVKSKLSAS